VFSSCGGTRLEQFVTFCLVVSIAASIKAEIEDEHFTRSRIIHWTLKNISNFVASNLRQPLSQVEDPL